MAKGICGFGPCSLGVGDVCDRASLKKFGLPIPGGIVEVGDGNTSLSLDGGSFRSEVQIPVPQVKVEEPWWPRPMVADDVECEAHGLALASAAGVDACEVVGDIELLANEPFLGCGSGTWEVSFNQEARRTGFCGCTGG